MLLICKTSQHRSVDLLRRLCVGHVIGARNDQRPRRACWPMLS